MKNYYQILGLESNASKDEIRKAYRLYAQHYHPDKQDGDKFFEQRFIEIKSAYDILIDDNKRKAYDLSQNSSNKNLQNDSFYAKETQLRKKELDLMERELKLKQEELSRAKREEELKKKEAELKQKENQLRYEQEIKKEKEKVSETKNDINTDYKIQTTPPKNNIGNFSYEVEGFYYSKTLGKGFAKQEANGIFLVIKLSLSNIANKTESIEDSMFKLVDMENNQFDTSIEGTNGLLMSGIKTFGVYGKDCHPNILTKGYVAFEVPKEAEYSIVLSNSWETKTISLLNFKKLIEADEQKGKDITSSLFKEAFLVSENGTTKFNCGTCKKEFYADRTKDSIVICPHCKTTNSISKFQEALSQPTIGTTKYTCGICKKVFYADRTKNEAVICPHCKSKNNLPLVKIAKGSGINKMTLIILAGCILLLILFVIFN